MISIVVSTTARIIAKKVLYFQNLKKKKILPSVDEL